VAINGAGFFAAFPQPAIFNIRSIKPNRSTMNEYLLTSEVAHALIAE